jgi:hypothetical protein
VCSHSFTLWGSNLSNFVNYETRISPSAIPKCSSRDEVLIFQYASVRLPQVAGYFILWVNICAAQEQLRLISCHAQQVKNKVCRHSMLKALKVSVEKTAKKFKKRDFSDTFVLLGNI